VEAPAARTTTRRTATMVSKTRMRLKKREIGPEPNHFFAPFKPCPALRHRGDKAALPSAG
jgi:hypothetical protein